MESLDKIIELAHGKWPEDLTVGISCVKETKDSPAIKVKLSSECEWFTKQQYMQRLKELTGRPDVKDWPEWAKYCAQDADGEWCVYDEKPFIFNEEWETLYECNRIHMGKTITNESWKNSLISRQEAGIVDKHNEKWIPEPGTECECRVENLPWCKVEFVGRKSNGHIVVLEDDDYWDSKEEYIKFRPIQTDKERWIDEALKSLSGVENLSARNIVESIFDAGLAKI